MTEEGKSLKELMIEAIGYQIAKDHLVTPIVGRAWTREVLVYGAKAPHFREVSRAAQDIYGPMIKAIAPIVQSVFTAMIQATHSVCTNGQQAELRRRESENDVQ